jgi:hypothetical protein
MEKYPWLTLILSDVPIPPALQRKRYYHGTSQARKAPLIWKKGILPDISGIPEGNVARPVKGRVYLALNLKEALPYMLGGDMAGSEVPSVWLRPSPYGYLFIVDGKDLQDIQPDEDQVGKAVHDRAFPWLDDYLQILRAESPEADPEIEDEEGNLVPNVDGYHYLSTLLEQVDEGEYTGWIKAGHVLLPLLEDSEKIDIVEKYGNVAHAGKVMPTEMWRFDKNDSPKLKRDGSNFFELAKLVGKR